MLLNARPARRSPVISLSWGFSMGSDHPMLAVGTAETVRVLMQTRSSVDDLNTVWNTVYVTNVTDISPSPLAAFTMLPDGSTFTVAGQQVFVTKPDEPTLLQILDGNSPLPDYHRFNLEQCIVWNKISVVEDILTRMNESVKDGVAYRQLDPEAYWLSSSNQVRGLSTCFSRALSHLGLFLKQHRHPRPTQMEGQTRCIYQHGDKHSSTLCSREKIKFFSPSSIRSIFNDSAKPPKPFEDSRECETY